VPAETRQEPEKEGQVFELRSRDDQLAPTLRKWLVKKMKELRHGADCTSTDLQLLVARQQHVARSPTIGQRAAMENYSPGLDPIRRNSISEGVWLRLCFFISAPTGLTKNRARGHKGTLGGPFAFLRHLHIEWGLDVGNTQPCEKGCVTLGMAGGSEEQRTSPPSRRRRSGKLETRSEIV
jgi:hypothetical protein